MSIPRGAISSPALRITIGTTGTPACMAMWKAPFLKGSSFGVGERVPSGAITSEVPLRSASTAGARAAWALVESVRSTYATSASQPIGANIGSVASSFLATAVKSLAQQRGQHRHVELALVVEEEDRGPGAPQVVLTDHVRASRRPAASDSSEAIVAAASSPVRRSRLSSPSPSPAATPAPSPAIEAAVRATVVGVSRLTRVSRVIGQPRSCGLGGEAEVGVERVRPADLLEVGHVLATVAVGVGLREVDAALGGELAGPPGPCRGPTGSARAPCR